MSVSFNYTENVNHTKPSVYWVSTLYGDVSEYVLKPEILIKNQLKDSLYNKEEKRIATINFQFDDGNVKDSSIFSIFKNKNIPCGFALISNIGTYRIDEYLYYQDNGFEILSHSTNTSGMNDPTTTEEEIETRLKNSRKTLEGYGFNIRGWVTPYSVMHESFRPLVAKYYDYGTTISYGTYDGSSTTPYQDITTKTNELKRVSLQTTTLVNQKKAVDEAIENNGFLTFYGHSADLDTDDYETTNNLNELLTYILTKVSDLQCVVLKPSDAVDYYFHVRHSDYLNLLSD